MIDVDWYYIAGGHPRGPVSDEGLEKLLRSGQIDPSTCVWRLGMQEWTPLRARDRGHVLQDQPSEAPASRMGVWMATAGCPAVIGALLITLYCLVRNAQDTADPRANALALVATGLALTLALFGATPVSFAATRSPVRRMLSLFYSVAGTCLACLLMLLAPVTLKVARAADSMSAYQISVVEQGETLQFVGEIGPGSGRAINKAIARHAGIRSIVIDSPGGLIQQARRIGDLVERRGMAVVIRNDCASACLIVLMASPHRSAQEGAVIGLHSPSQLASVNSYLSAAAPDSAQAYFGYLQAHGLPAKLLALARATPADEVTFVDSVDLVDEGVLEGIRYQGRLFAPRDPDWQARAALFRKAAG